MKTLLRIDSSFNQANSFSRQAADHYEVLWRQQHPNNHIIYRDLEQKVLPHLSKAAYEAFNKPEEGKDHLKISDQLIEEMEQADTILISSPVHNFSVPSSLKSYIDHVLRINKTFGYDPVSRERKGLLVGKSAAVIVARGGLPLNGESPDGVENYLSAILNYIGINEVKTFSVNGTAYPGSEEQISTTMTEISQCFE
ncbi:FMN-dependent NADH-azoreductase [Flagellimonas hymeniacidonis]|uniref:FMN dependent NADH:quinone oxidoreductase n=1 Tax=Flagellimonas hymeniacidonis TaxID=2603628 RepID=A0A5C8V9H2_9FLAO|nr:NAD(P)H-dependent oxidoreductase [Flagellimonas hymeniacidonis]TXN37849.1 FMN-dependent NADH-azoreductase [Flagellimonas hymeniacidonis]